MSSNMLKKIMCLSIFCSMTATTFASGTFGTDDPNGVDSTEMVTKREVYSPADTVKTRKVRVDEWVGSLGNDGDPVNPDDAANPNDPVTDVTVHSPNRGRSLLAKRLGQAAVATGAVVLLAGGTAMMVVGKLRPGCSSAATGSGGRRSLNEMNTSLHKAIRHIGRVLRGASSNSTSDFCQYNPEPCRAVLCDVYQDPDCLIKPVSCLYSSEICSQDICAQNASVCADPCIGECPGYLCPSYPETCAITPYQYPINPCSANPNACQQICDSPTSGTLCGNSTDCTARPDICSDGICRGVPAACNATFVTGDSSYFCSYFNVCPTIGNFCQNSEACQAIACMLYPQLCDLVSCAVSPNYCALGICGMVPQACQLPCVGNCTDYLCSGLANCALDFCEKFNLSQSLNIICSSLSPTPALTFTPTPTPTFTPTSAISSFINNTSYNASNLSNPNYCVSADIIFWSGTALVVAMVVVPILIYLVNKFSNRNARRHV